MKRLPFYFAILASGSLFAAPDSLELNFSGFPEPFIPSLPEAMGFHFYAALPGHLGGTGPMQQAHAAGLPSSYREVPWTYRPKISTYHPPTVLNSMDFCLNEEGHEEQGIRLDYRYPDSHVGLLRLFLHW